MGSGKTTFKKSEVARIVEGVKVSGALGTFEFQLNSGVFHMTGQSVVATAVASSAANPWDKVLPNGKAKPALTVLKKIP
jgi:hypothetical protein